MADNDDDFKILKITSDDVDKLRRDMMGLDVKRLDLPRQFEVTNERMLAVRDDLMFFVNQQHASLARVIRSDVEKAIRSLTDISRKQDERHAATIRALESLREQFVSRLVRRRKPGKKKVRRKAR